MHPLHVGTPNDEVEAGGSVVVLPLRDPSPARQPNSVRRTSTMDMSFDETGAELTLRGSGRDLATGHDLDARVLATARTEVTIDIRTRTITGLLAPPYERRRTDALVGLPAGSGFRRAVRSELPEFTGHGSLLGLLLDEVPVAMVIAGSLRRRFPMPAPRLSPPVDVCAGWADGGLLAVTTIATGSPPMRDGPLVAPISCEQDVDAWHPVADLSAWSMRRARRLDVVSPAAAGDTYEVDTFFRDSRSLQDGVERGVHEYEIRAVVDRGGTVVDIDALPHVLPAPECPAAALSAQRLVGMSLAQVREDVAASFSGTSTCTHLNDALRALGDLGFLISPMTDDGQVHHG